MCLTLRLFKNEQGLHQTKPKPFLNRERGEKREDFIEFMYNFVSTSTDVLTSQISLDDRKTAP